MALSLDCLCVSEEIVCILAHFEYIVSYRRCKCGGFKSFRANSCSFHALHCTRSVASA